MKLEKDLTKGNIATQLVKFAFPLLVANLLQSLYNIVDMLVVGRIVGSIGVVAISNASSLVFVINAICLGSTVGGSVLIARYKGAEDPESQKQTIGTVYTVTAVLALIVTVIGLLVYKPILAKMRVPIESMEYTIQYMFVILLGTFFVFGYNATCSILRGLGDSIRPLLFVAVAALVNMLLDILLVGTFQLGTVGAAYATVIAQGVSFLLSIIYLKKQKFVFDFRLKIFAVKKDKLKAVLRISLPTTIQMSVVNLSYMVIAAMMNRYGVTVAAAAGIGLKINTFAGMPCWAVGQAMTTMVGQNMGAGKFERTEKVGTMGLRINVVTTAVVVVFIQIFARQLIMLFDPINAAVIEEGIRYLRICCFGNSLIYATMYTFDSFAVGVGTAPLAMIDALLDSAIIRLPLCWVFSVVAGSGSTGVYWGQALSPILPAVIGACYFYSKRWKETIDWKK